MREVRRLVEILSKILDMVFRRTKMGKDARDWRSDLPA